jgi:cyanophycinase
MTVGRRDGAIALVGSGEFLPAMDEVDLALLSRLPSRARVAIVPTASAPDGDAVFERWMKIGVEHFTRLGAQAVPIPLKTRADAEDPRVADALAQADLAYLSGGKPAYLRDALRRTASWQAIAGVYERGGVVAGCSAGAMVLAETMLDFPNPARSVPALGLAPGLTVIPHFDEIPGAMGSFLSLVLRFARTSETTVVGIDGGTALVCSDGRWTVLGRGGVTALNGAARGRYLAGQIVPGHGR